MRRRRLALVTRARPRSLRSGATQLLLRVMLNANREVLVVWETLPGHFHRELGFICDSARGAEIAHLLGEVERVDGERAAGHSEHPFNDGLPSGATTM